MAEHVTQRRLDLSIEQAVRLFQEHFGQKYTVCETKLIGADFVIKKSEWIGVVVKFKHQEDKTVIRYFTGIPSVAVRLCVLGFIVLTGVIPALILLLILWLTNWKGMLEEVGEFVENSPALRGETPVAETVPAEGP